MSDQATIENKLLALKQKYLQSLPEKLETITSLWHACAEQMRIDDNALESALHKLAGSAGMYEEDELGQIARNIELIIAESSDTLNAQKQQQITEGLKQLEEKIQQLTA